MRAIRQQVILFVGLLLVVALPAAGRTGAFAESRRSTTEFDLIKNVDVQRDGVSGEWTRSAEGIETTGGQSILAFPDVPPSNYRWTVVVERVKGTEGLNLVLPIAGRQAMVVLQGFGEAMASGLNLLGGNSADRNATTQRRKIFEDGAKCVILCKVHKNSIQVSCNGVIVINWVGDPTTLSIDRRFWSKLPLKKLAVTVYENDVRWRISYSRMSELLDSDVDSKTDQTIHSAPARPAGQAGGGQTSMAAPKMPVAPTVTPPTVTPPTAPQPTAPQPTAPQPTRHWTMRKIGDQQSEFTAQMVQFTKHGYVMSNEWGGFEVYHVDLSPESQALAEKLKEDLIAKRKNAGGRARGAVIATRHVLLDEDGKIFGPIMLQGFSSGFFYYRDKDKKTKKAYHKELSKESLIAFYRSKGQNTDVLEGNKEDVLEGKKEIVRLELLRLAGGRTAYPCNYVGLDGEDVIFRGQDKKLFRVYRFAIEPQELARLQKAQEQADAERKSEVAQSLDEVELRLLRSKEGTVIGPARPIQVKNRTYLAQRADGLEIRVSVNEIEPRDFWEVRGEIYRRNTKTTKDPAFDARFKRELADAAPVKAVPPLDQELRDTLDEIAKPIDRRWAQKRLDIGSGQRVLGVVDDGSVLLIGGDRPHLLQTEIGKRTVLPVDWDKENSLAFIAPDGSKVWIVTDGAVFGWDVKKKRRIEKLVDVQGSLVGGCLSSNGKRLLLLNRTGMLFIVTLEKHHVRVAGIGKYVHDWTGATLLSSADGQAFGVFRDTAFGVFTYDPTKDEVTRV